MKIMIIPEKKALKTYAEIEIPHCFSFMCNADLMVDESGIKIMDSRMFENNTNPRIIIHVICFFVMIL
jgi:hypothetical protein